MQQVSGVKQKTRQIKTAVTFMLNGRTGDFYGHESFHGPEIVGVASVRDVSFDANAISFQPSLSRNLTGKPAISARWL